MRDEEFALIKAFKDGDNAAFDKLVDRFKHKAFSLAYQWTNNREDALDVCQEAFIKMYRVLPGWRPKSSLFTWLYRVIINLSIDLHRKKRKMKLTSTDLLEEKKRELSEKKLVSTANSLRSVEAKEIDEKIYEAVMKLPEKQQKAFILRHYQGLSLKDISRIQRCSVGAVKANLFQAVRKLRKELLPQLEMEK